MGSPADDFEFEYLGELEFLFETTVGYESGSFDGENRLQKYCDTVPLNVRIVTTLEWDHLRESPLYIVLKLKIVFDLVQICR